MTKSKLGFFLEMKSTSGLPTKCKMYSMFNISKQLIKHCKSDLSRDIRFISSSNRFLNNFRFFSSSSSNSKSFSDKMANVTVFPDIDTATAQILIVDEQTKNCAILDSVLNYAAASGKTSTTSIDKILAVVEEKGYTVQWILESHIHADHLSASYYIKSKYPQAKTAIGEGARTVQKIFKHIFNLEHSFPVDGSQFDVLWKDGDKFQIGNLNVSVIHTPGHTPACVSYYIENDCIFVGDTIFMPDVGTARCDFPEGSAVTLFESMQKILALPEATKIYVCHDYPPAGRELNYLTTVGEQRKRNKHVKDGISREEFIEMRTARDATLKAPNLLLPSIQVNIRAGELPKPEDNGIAYIKIPLNYLKQ
ncbi:hydroxyacylglutathione hydrolase [Heterostelium album PN500]|uniref:Hydroxyacylglutathione hydrolase n=1 Tax=Heterostelium pallidum (strain ATCC 26659 / Pp 5 / PN500) TaxID=670386 RepID=D3BGK0_HETP5|nr:hydroxyacylglutathione hydrolase [Heterostelium album PN500]EFA79234.1 hydroxyacylglutathione hydrolase [Heterostelium album PN500]|eukprot:XP_020431355.1 hydroxyacylglutathione hydrolase [Heterostelium album PN500]